MYGFAQVGRESHVVHHADDSPARVRLVRPMRLPIGLSFGQKRRAIVSLMMTTCRLAVASAVKVRP